MIAATSASVSGTGFDPGPTNPVTPRTLRTTCQDSSVMSILTRTYEGNSLLSISFSEPPSVSTIVSVGMRTSAIRSERPLFSTIFSMFAMTRFS